MHHHLEIILPPVANIEAAIAQILAPFDDNGDDEDGQRNNHAFWDWYVIGGRWAGVKLECTLDAKKKEEFFAELTRREVTVSGVQAGKQKLQPESQIPMVDALWKEYFPDSPLNACPFFAHFSNQYQNSNGFPDVMPLKDMPKELEASHVIIAGPHWKDAAKLEAKYMVRDSVWNGVNHVEAKWDGKVLSAIKEHRKKLKNYKPEYAEKYTPQDDWLVVTVDYHS